MKETKFSRDQVLQAIAGASSIKDVIQNLGMKINPGNYRQVHKYVQDHGLSLPLFNFKKQASGLSNFNKLPDREYFSLGVLRSGSNIKKRLLDSGKVDICQVCGQLPEWRGRPLTLQVDHIDGNKFNNLIENLRFICPNCHTQTSTYGSRGRGSGSKTTYRYCTCGVRIFKTSEKCGKCRVMHRVANPLNKFKYPSVGELLEVLKTKSFEQIGRELGCSGNAVRKYLKVRGIRWKSWPFRVIFD